MGAARDTYRAMLRDRVAPGLRALGMRGSSGSFSLPDPTHHLLVGFQASVSSTGARVRFTVNLATIDRGAWVLRVPPPGRPEPSASSVGLVGVHMRLGEVMPVQDDVWWDVLHDEDTTAVADHVCVAVQEYGIPWLLRARSLPESSTPWLEIER